MEQKQSPEKYRLTHPTPIAIKLALAEEGFPISQEVWARAVARARRECRPFLKGSGDD